jgi:uncharacterized protein
MRSKLYIKGSSIQGLGVFALLRIHKGELILRIDDSRLVTFDHPLRPELGEFDYHCDYLASGKTILMMSPERYINHCCEPNSFVKTINDARYIFALRDIARDEEITNDYCINGFGDTIWECNCGSPRCRSKIHSDFFHLRFEKQVEYLSLLDEWYLQEYEARVADLIGQFLDI